MGRAKWPQARNCGNAVRRSGEALLNFAQWRAVGCSKWNGSYDCELASRSQRRRSTALARLLLYLAQSIIVTSA